jgi:hypothetical protein
MVAVIFESSILPCWEGSVTANRQGGYGFGGFGNSIYKTLGIVKLQYNSVVKVEVITLSKTWAQHGLPNQRRTVPWPCVASQHHPEVLQCW